MNITKFELVDEITEGNKVVAYKLRTSQGGLLRVPLEDVMSAYKRKLIHIEGLVYSEINGIPSITNKNNGSFVVLNNSPKTEKGGQMDKNGQVKENKIATSPSSAPSSDSDIQRIHELVKTLNKAREVYEQGTDDIMTNFEYDKLYDELITLEKKTNTVLSNSPTINVGYEVISKLPKEKHSKPMLSLGKTKDRDELASFIQGKEGVLSWKMDGLTVVMEYNNGKLDKAVTRGNGEIGEVVTSNAKQFKHLPQTISFKGHLLLRGEAVISYNNFERINNSLPADEEKYKNPRNLCSGSVRQLDSGVTAQRSVEWYCFEVVECDSPNFPNEVDKQLDFISSLGFNSVEYKVVNSQNIKSTIEYFEQKVLSKSYEIPTDGLVLTFRDKKYGLSLGNTAKTPRHSMAFKWQDETAMTNLVNIEWQVGRSGVITPVAVFNPVDIEGSTVERASLHNLSIMNELLGKPYIGQKVEIYKANMIIPNVLWGESYDATGVPESDIKFIGIPDSCPCCSEETVVKIEPKSGVRTLWCTNVDCDARGNRLLGHFVSRDAMNIDGISEATLNTLVQADIISDFVSIYHIKDYRDEIIDLEGFGVQSFNKMVNAIDKSRSVKLANLIYALGIPNVGLSTAKLICKNFKNDLAKTVTATYSDLVNIDGIGDVIAENFYNYFHTKENIDQFAALVKELQIVKEEISTNTSMAGTTICVTGDVYVFPNRRAIKDLVESLGGKLTGSVSKSTSYLVTNDTESGSNKNKAAKQYGIPILTEEQFIDKFNLRSYV
jgi:DNA ligase (NAD+)